MEKSSPKTRWQRQQQFAAQKKSRPHNCRQTTTLSSKSCARSLRKLSLSTLPPVGCHIGCRHPFDARSMKSRRCLRDTKDEEQKSKLAHLRELFRLPLDARTEGELRDWRRTISDEPSVNVERLTDIAFSCKLEDQWAEQTRHKTVQKESVPMIICTEALV